MKEAQRAERQADRMDTGGLSCFNFSSVEQRASRALALYDDAASLYKRAGELDSACKCHLNAAAMTALLDMPLQRALRMHWAADWRWRPERSI